MIAAEPREAVDWTLRIPNIILGVIIDQGPVEVCTIILALRNCSLPIRLAAQQLINDLNKWPATEATPPLLSPSRQVRGFPSLFMGNVPLHIIVWDRTKSSMPYVGPRGLSQMLASALKVSITGTIWVNNPCFPRWIFNWFGMENIRETDIDIRTVLDFHVVGVIWKCTLHLLMHARMASYTMGLQMKKKHTFWNITPL